MSTPDKSKKTLEETTVDERITPIPLQQNPSLAQAVEPQEVTDDDGPNRGINDEVDTIAARGDVPEDREAGEETVKLSAAEKKAAAADDKKS
jgi:hypothetical protein